MAKLFVALDYPRPEAAMQAARELSGVVDGFKIGLELFCAAGRSIVEEVRSLGSEVFLDLKLHDIPATVARTLSVLDECGVNYTNVHVTGTRPMLEAAMAQLCESGSKMKLLGVTVLTSIEQRHLDDLLGVSISLPQVVERMARAARSAGLAGVVASPQEAAAVRQACGPDFVIVSPGIRPRTSALDDQARVATPAQAVADGVDVLVVGRPITRAEDMAQAAARIAEEMR